MFGKAASGSLISCTGATSSIKWAYAVKDETSQAIALITLVDGIQVDIINNAPVWLSKELMNEMPSGEVPDGFSISNGVYKFTNNDSIPHRIEFVILNPEFFRSVVSDNPTELQMTPIVGERIGACLSPQQNQFICTPETASTSVQLFKARDTLPFLTFANVAFNIYENGTKVAHEQSLLNVAEMSSIGLEVLFLDETNRLINISSKDGFNSRAIVLQPTMAIINDIDISQGDAAVKNADSIFMCLAKKPT
ncbi:hypothetical protein J537_2301 [Acinetobacter baumannii 1437282]|nr:hypothetical protein J537_2301 [Acinetobacter baumannii 1437282]